MQGTASFKAGDRVRHENRPEWGIGVVQQATPVSVGGKPSQRLVVRFGNAGLKTLSTIGAALVAVEAPAEHEPPDLRPSGGQAGTSALAEPQPEGGWLASISKRKPEDAFMGIPASASDPFLPLEARLKATLNLWRFEPAGRSLIDWAVAQTGVNDPLSRHTRHELEQYFDRWSFVRQKHLARLLDEARFDTGLIESALAEAPPAARKAVARYNASR